MSKFDFVQALKEAKGLGASWKLPEFKTLGQKPESDFQVLEDKHHGEESVFDPDDRERISPSDFADGGEYRSIVKISMRYEGMGEDDDRWAIGTGYLVAPDVLITAGHCVFHHGDGGQGLGRLTHMRCFIGYDGKNSVGKSSVQFRAATKVVTTAKYVIDGARSSDVAFVKVDQPFEGHLNLFKYQDTPLKDTSFLGIIGYPGDKFFAINGERGAQMYGLIQPETFDLAASPRNMLEYRISTAGGQCGAPVLKFKLGGRQPEAVIGTHCYGGPGNNSASVIGGQYGNDYKALIAGLSNSSNVYVTDISKGIPNVDVSPETGPEPASEAWGFFDVLKDIGSVVTKVAPKVLDVALPILTDTVKSHARKESIFDDTPSVPVGPPAAPPRFNAVSEAAVKVKGASANGFVNGPETNPDAPIFIPAPPCFNADSEAAVKGNGASADGFVNGPEPNPDAPIFVPGHLAPQV